MRTETVVPVPQTPLHPVPPRARLFPDDESLLPEGSVVDGRGITHDTVDAADYVVIGTGAAGATAAVVLAEGGYRVVMLEEGPWIRARHFDPDVWPAMEQMYRDLGAQLTVGAATYAVFQGRCVGG